MQSRMTLGCGAGVRAAPRGAERARGGARAVVRARRAMARVVKTFAAEHELDAMYMGGRAERDEQTLTLEIGTSRVTLARGKIGLQANGAVMATEGETIVYSTACASRDCTGDGSFVPLTVNYAERFSAAGRTSGGYKKRDGGLRENETLKARLVDRPIRPMMYKGWGYETQILQWVMSYDGTRSTDALAITAASAALAVSDIPLKKPVVGVRVGLAPGSNEPIINPTAEQMKTSRLDLVLAGTDEAVLMIEGFCDFLTTDEMLLAIEKGHEAVAKACKEIDVWAAAVGKPKMMEKLIVAPDGIDEEVEALVGEDLTKAIVIPIKQERGAAIGGIRERAVAALSEKYKSSDVINACGKIESRALRDAIRTNGRRQDGRTTSMIRPIACEAGLLPRTHGSSLFTRGETQAIGVATLGGKGDAQRQDDVEAGEDKRFMLHYFFPPSSVGETGRTGGASRREVGHGNLAERALNPVLPSEADFPFVTRLESTITESNGSSSMATVCAGTLALLDAGVPIKRKVAGIAMGLILGSEASGGGDKLDPIVLTDILGSEDALGDMDFKVAGDKDGITAFQMDIKVEGITIDVMRTALQEAQTGLVHILGEMEKCNPAPAGAMSKYAPQVGSIPVAEKYFGKVIGKGGETIRSIIEQTKVDSIDVDKETQIVTVTGGAGSDVGAALEYIKNLIAEPEIGKIYRDCVVKKVVEFGAFVEYMPGQEGLCHISELDVARVPNASDVVTEGQTIDVKLVEVNSRGQTRLSRKEVLLEENPELAAAAAASRRDGDSSDDSSESREGGGRGGRGGRGGGGRGGGQRRDSGGF